MKNDNAKYIHESAITFVAPLVVINCGVAPKVFEARALDEAREILLVALRTLSVALTTLPEGLKLCPVNIVLAKTEFVLEPPHPTKASSLYCGVRFD